MLGSQPMSIGRRLHRNSLDRTGNSCRYDKRARCLKPTADASGRSALMHDTPPRYVRGKARCSVFELYLRSCWVIRMTSPVNEGTLRPLNSQWVIKQHRWDVSQLTTVVRVVVKDDLVQEYPHSLLRQPV